MDCVVLLATRKHISNAFLTGAGAYIMIHIDIDWGKGSSDSDTLP